MKICIKCNIAKSLTEFTYYRCSPDGRLYYCKICKREIDTLWRRSHRIQINEYQNRKRFKRKEKFQDLKNQPCTDCGVIYPPWAMDFDHVNGIKKFEISSAINTGYSKKQLADELAKCELVCANCHRIRTYNRSISTQNAFSS